MTCVTAQLHLNDWVPARPNQSRRDPRNGLSGSATRTDWDGGRRGRIKKETAALGVARQLCFLAA
jgi:hypothetical protein